MPLSREPRIQTAAILSLRPTQITVGMREVEAKRARWRQQAAGKQADFLGSHLIPVILGPRNRRYIIDHHHLALALHQEGVTEVATTVVADLSAQPRATFWVALDHHGWVHPYDREGQRRPYKVVPEKVSDMVDDPYRSLAGELRLRGGFAKDTTPFSEFLWADFLRYKVKGKLIKHDFRAALRKAQHLAHSQEANYLPGWSGPTHILE